METDSLILCTKWPIISLKGESLHHSFDWNETEFVLQTQKVIPTVIANLDKNMIIKQFDLLSLQGWQSDEILDDDEWWW